MAGRRDQTPPTPAMAEVSKPTVLFVNFAGKLQPHQDLRGGDNGGECARNSVSKSPKRSESLSLS